MSSILERRYRLLLASYPPEYLDQHEEEILSTLLDGSTPNQVRPTFREAKSLVISGLRTRVRRSTVEGQARGWENAARLGALLLLASVLSDRLAFGSDWVALRPTAIVACALVAVVLGFQRAGLLLVLLALSAGQLAGPNQELIFPLRWVPTLIWVQNNLSLFGAALALGSAWILHRGPRRPWSWWLVGAVIVIPFVYQVFGVETILSFNVPLSVTELLLPVAILSGAGLLLHDPRPAIAATMYAAVHLAVPIVGAALMTIPFGLGGLRVGFDHDGPITLVVACAALASAVVSLRWQAEDLAVPSV
jgi:hypothetical protein